MTKETPRRGKARGFWLSSSDAVSHINNNYRMPSLGSRHPVADQKIVLTNGPGPSVVLNIVPALTEAKGHLFADIDRAYIFAMELNDVTGWAIADLVDSQKVGAS